jgi:PAS domain S-box-containing protein
MGELEISLKSFEASLGADKQCLPAAQRALDQGREIFEESPLGIIEVDLDQQVRYANPAALRMLGAKSYSGVRLSDVVSDAEAAKTLQQQREERRAGMIGNYRVTVSRISDGKLVPLEITGVPLYDTNGRVTGSLGIFRSREKEQLLADIHDLNRRVSKPTALVRQVAERLRQAIPYDLMIFTRYSEDLKHAHSFYMHSTEGKWKAQKRWYPLTKAQAEWLRESAQLCGDLQALFEDSVWSSFRDDPFVQRLKAGNFRTFLRRSIHRPRSLVASVSLLSRTAHVFTPQHVQMLNEAPVDVTVLSALDLVAQRQRNERLELMKSLNRCTSVQTACKVLAEQLVDIFEWSHVSLFRVDYVARKIRMLAQYSPPNVNVRLPERYEQDIDDGILGRVVREQRGQNVPDVKSDPDYKLGVTSSEVNSELCVPIAFEGGKTVRWIINVEDKSQNAFSSDESSALTEVAREVSSVMQRISQLYFLTECFDHTADPIFVTDVNLAIKKKNAAASRLLDTLGHEADGGDFVQLFADPDTEERLRGGSSDDLGEFTLKYACAGGEASAPLKSNVPVYVSRHRFPEALGGYIFVTRDIHHIRRNVELQLLEQAAYQVAIETTSPLALAIAELQELSKSGGLAAASRVENVLRQLSRVKNTYARLAMFNPDARPTRSQFTDLHLETEVDAVLTTFPSHLYNMVQVSTEPDLPTVHGDHARIEMMLEVILSALVRSAPEAEPVRLTIAHAPSAVEVRLCGYLSCAASADGPAGRDRNDQLQLAQPLIRQFMAEHDGAFEHVARGDLHELVLRFPAQGARHE